MEERAVREQLMHNRKKYQTIVAMREKPGATQQVQSRLKTATKQLKEEERVAHTPPHTHLCAFLLLLTGRGANKSQPQGPQSAHPVQNVCQQQRNKHGKKKEKMPKPFEASQ